MKTKCLRIGKRSLSVFLSVLMIVSTVIIGDWSSLTASADTITCKNNGDAILYFNMGTFNWWNAFNDGGSNAVVFFDSNKSDDTRQFVTAKTKESGGLNSTTGKFYVEVPAGTWHYVRIIRANTNPASSSSNWWNKTGFISLKTNQNYISKFAQGDSNSDTSSTTTWGSEIPSVTYSLASSATSTTTNTEVTFTLENTSNNAELIDETENKYVVKVKNSSGSYVDTNAYTETENGLSFSAEGDYRVTKSVKYTAKGYSTLSGTATMQNSVDISVEDNITLYNNTVANNDSHVKVASQVAAGKEVTVTVTPESGKMVDTITAVTDGGENVTINGSSDENDDYKYTGTYTMPGDNVTITVTYKTAPKNTKTIYFDNSVTKWDTIHVYAWDSSNTAVTAAYPGSIMTKVSDNLYTFEMPNTAVGMLFDWGNDERKTGNITTITEGKTYTPADGTTISLRGEDSITSADNSNIKASWSLDNLLFDIDEFGKFYVDVKISGSKSFKPYKIITGGSSYWCGPSDGKDTTITTNNSVDVKQGANGNVVFSGTSNIRYRIFLDPAFLYSTENANLYIRQVYDVTTTASTNGSVTIDRTTAVAGDKITITATPNSGYRLSSVKVKNTTVTMTKQADGTYKGTYTAAAGDVSDNKLTVTATFEEDAYTGLSAAIQKSDDGLNWSTVDNTDSLKAGLSKATANVSLNDVPTATLTGSLDGYTFMGWYSSKGSFGNDTLTSTTFTPNGNNAVAYARFAKNYTLKAGTATGGSISFVTGTQSSGSKAPNASAVSATSNTTETPIGSTATIQVSPESGFVLDKLTVTGDSENTSVNETLNVQNDVVENQYTFEMIYNDNVTITPTFIETPKYTIQVSTKNNDVGTAAAFASEVSKGGSVTITYTDNATSSYYEFSNWEIEGSYSETDVDLTSKEITISPTSNIIAVAAYKFTLTDNVPLTNTSSKQRYISFSQNENPTTFTNSIAVYHSYKSSDSDKTDKTCYALLNGSSLPSVNSNFYFVFSNGDVSSLFHQETYKSDNTLRYEGSEVNTDEFSVTSANTSLVEVVDVVRDYNRTNVNSDGDWIKYHFSTIKIKSSAVKAIIFKVLPTDSTASSPSYGKKYEIIPLTEDISSTSSETVTVYAKNGTVRDDIVSATARPDGVYDLFSRIASTTIKDYNTKSEIGEDYLGSQADYYTVNSGTARARVKKATVNKGSKIIVTTTIPAAYSGYYVKAFSVNGVSYNVIDEATAKTKIDETTGIGTYSFEYTIPKNTSAANIEITPIFFHFDDGETEYITFYVEDYDLAAAAEWGNTLACYAWYSVGGSQYTTTEALGGYPGQPLVNDGGVRYIQIPKTYNGNPVQGITLNNYVWDDVHAVAGENITSVKGDSNYYSDRSNHNYQTYDYDDFSKLANIDDVDTITFRFKYKTGNQPSGTNANNQNHNWSDPGEKAKVNYPNYTDYNNSGATYTYKGSTHTDWGNAPKNSLVTTNGYVANGFEEYRNITGDYPIDLFNHELADKEVASNEKYKIVSNGYMNVYFGYFGTLWSIYKPDGTYVGTLPSSAFFYEVEEKDENGNWVLKSELTKDGELTAEVPSDFITTDNRLYNEKEGYWKTFVALYNGGALEKQVEISYESAIYASYPDLSSSSKGVSIAWHDSDPANRCDGRWFYSKKSDTIYSRIVIQYKPLGESTYSTDSNVYQREGRNTGDVTKASAYFTDNGIGLKDNLYAYYKNTNYTGDVTRSTTSAFDFYADEVGADITDKETGDTSVYVFQGWYYLNNGVETEVNPTDIAKLTGSEVKTKSYTLIAKYAQVEKTNFKISHKLLNTEIIDNNVSADDIIGTDDKTITPHDGDGNTYVKVEILNASGFVVDTITTSDDQSECEISSLKLREYAQQNGYQMRITLTTSPKDEANPDNLKLGGFYDKANTTVTDEETGEETDKTYYYKGSESAPILSSSNENTNINTDETWNKTTNTYTIYISDLFSDNTYTALRTDCFELFSDIIRTIAIKFKYYDRAKLFGEAADIAETASTVKYSDYEVPYNNSLDQFQIDYSERISSANINNILDEIQFWVSQESAVGSIKYLKDYQHADNKLYEKSVGNVNDTYGNTYASNLNILQYHTDRYGVPQNSDNEYWVNYYTVKDSTGQNNAVAEKNLTDLSEIKEIVIWGYNSPKPYDFKAHYTPESTDKIQIPSLGSFAEQGGIYIDTTAAAAATDIKNDNDGSFNDHPTYLTGFYNQRIGIVDPRGVTGGTDDVPAYLKGHGIESAYFGYNAKITKDEQGNAAIKYETDAKEIKAAEYVNNGDNKLVFDGWYIKDNTGYHKISSERSYQNRITNDIEIFAGYAVAPTDDNGKDVEYTDAIGVAVTQNATDKYVAEDGTDMIRFNSQLNVFGRDVDMVDGDKNIKDVAVIYYQLPTTDVNGNPIDWSNADNNNILLGNIKSNVDDHIKKHLALLESKMNGNSPIAADGIDYYLTTSTKTIFKVTVDGVELDAKGKVIWYTYQIDGAADEASHVTVLTNKNRMQFTWAMSLEDYNNMKFLTFVAMKYETQETNENGEVTSADWKISENYITNIDLPTETSGTTNPLSSTNTNSFELVKPMALTETATE